MKTAIYARVSTHDKGQDIGMQTRDLEQFTQARGWQLVDSYLDVGISGSKDRRPELDRLMADAHRRRFDVVLVWKLDRLGRSLRHLINTIAEFEALGIAFVSMRDNLDLTTNAQAKGTHCGRPKAVLDVKRALELRNNGLSWAAIGRELGVSENTAARASVKTPSPDAAINSLESAAVVAKPNT